MKTIFFTGKGGVGKSTLSAATAWQLAREKYKVLAVSFDPAHNLGDIFKIKLGDRKKKLNQHLSLLEVDLKKIKKKQIKDSMNLMQSVYSYLKPFHMEKYFNILKYTPGMEEYSAILAIEQIINQEQKHFDFILFDTPPTGLTVRVFALPGINLSWLEQLYNIRTIILDKRHTITRINARDKSKANEKIKTIIANDAVIKKLIQLKERYEQLDQFLKSNHNIIAVIFNPDYLSQRETERLINSLLELKLPLGVLLNNKVDQNALHQAEKIEKALIASHKNLKINRIGQNNCDFDHCYHINENLTQIFVNNEN